MSETQDVHDIASFRLSRAGHRYTAGRRAVVDVLQRAGRPLTLPEILELDPTLTQSSAYRHLGQLTAAEVVHRLAAGDEHAHFELAEDLTQHHHHLICRSCGSVSDVVVPPAFEQQLDETLGSLAAASGFVVDHHRLDLVGVCIDCR